MSMSTHIYGFKKPDDKWHRMKSVYDACTAAGLDVPDAVLRYFEHDRPDPAGVKVDLSDWDGIVEYKGEYEQGFEIEISEVPDDIAIIRVVNSW